MARCNSLVLVGVVCSVGTMFPVLSEAQTSELPQSQNNISNLEKRIDEQQQLILQQQRALNQQSEILRAQGEQLQELMSAKQEPLPAEKPDAKKTAKKNPTVKYLVPPPSTVTAETPALPLPPVNQVGSAPEVNYQPREQLHTSPQPLAIINQNPPPSPPQQPQQQQAQPKAPPQPTPQQPPQIQALADQGGVLSPRGMLTYENAFEYTNTTRNLFSFNGVQLAQVVLVGALNNNAARRQVVQYSGRARLGLTNRLEADIHVPYVYRNDAITGTDSTTGNTTRTTEQGYDLGDIDAGMSYQMNNGADGWPFLIGNLRYKANNADGPFDVPYDANNIATRLPTGTGFQTVEASITAIKVSDPAILFANLGYVYDIPRDINRTFATTRITSVDPGDAINLAFGVGFAINQDTSFSLGYKHSYVFSTTQHSVDVASGTPFDNRSDSQQVGALVLGLNYVLTPSTSINVNVEAGVTNDAPDIHLLFRVPIQLGDIF